MTNEAKQLTRKEQKQQKREARAAADQERREQQAKAQAERQAIAAEVAFRATPVGQALTAFERGDQLFQCAFEAVEQKATQSMSISIKGGLREITYDSNEILNRIVDVGWDLATASFVFQEEGSKIRGKVIGHEQAMVQGKTVGYYLFKRSN